MRNVFLYEETEVKGGDCFVGGRGGAGGGRKEAGLSHDDHVMCSLDN